MDNNNLDIEINFIDSNGQVITYETLKEIMEILMLYTDQFLDIIVTLCYANKYPNLVRKILDEYGEYFCFEMVIDTPDFKEEWKEVCRDFGLLPLFYVQCPEEKDFFEYCKSVEEVLNSIDGNCRAVVFIPNNSEQIEYLPYLYNIINKCSLKPCFMRLKFKRCFEITEKAIAVYHNFIDSMLSEYVLFDTELVQYYNMNNNVRFRTIECPKNFIYRMRLSRNSNAILVMPDKSLHEIGLTEKFFPGRLPLEQEISLSDFDLKTKSFMLKDGEDRFLYKFKNKNCSNCKLQYYCQNGVGEELEVPDDFCKQLSFFSYGFFQLKEKDDFKDKEKYPIRYPRRGADVSGLVATISQLGEQRGVIPPIKVVPGNTVWLKKNLERLNYVCEFDPIELTLKIQFVLIKDKYRKVLNDKGISNEQIDTIISFVKEYDLRVYARDLGIYKDKLYIYSFVPPFKDFEQIDNLLFDKKTKKRVANKPLKIKTT